MFEPRLTHPPELLLRYRAWCLAVSADVTLHRRVGRLREAAEIAHQVARVVPERPVQPGPLEHDRERHDAENEHQDEDPTGPQSHHRAFDLLDHCSSEL